MNKSFKEKVHVQSIRTTKYEIHIILNNDQRAEGSLPANPSSPPNYPCPCTQNITFVILVINRFYNTCTSA